MRRLGSLLPLRYKPNEDRLLLSDISVNVFGGVCIHFVKLTVCNNGV